MQYWLVKSEPGSYSIADLKRDEITSWDGVRNYQARNFMRDQMKLGDKVLFHHSSIKPMAIVGLAEVAKEAYADDTAFDKNDSHFDAKSDPKNPTWMMVDIRYLKTFKRPLSLSLLKKQSGLSGMMLVQKGSRLSVQPVKKKHFDLILELTKHTA